MINSRRSNSFIYFVTFVAYFLQCIVFAGGAVLCQEPVGGTSIEFACDHDHCEVTTVTVFSHDEVCHENSGCQCASCPCEDIPLISDMVRTPARSQPVQSSEYLPTISVCVLLSAFPRSQTKVLFPEYHPPPWLDEALVRRRTIVLIV